MIGYIKLIFLSLKSFLEETVFGLLLLFDNFIITHQLDIPLFRVFDLLTASILLLATSYRYLDNLKAGYDV